MRGFWLASGVAAAAAVLTAILALSPAAARAAGESGRHASPQLALGTSTAPAAVLVADRPPAPRRPGPARRPRSRRDTLDFRVSVVRTGILAAGIAVYAWGWISPRARRGRPGQLRRALLVALALAGYASYYQFFVWVHKDGFSTPDNFHYYVGSKYFEELGYYGLYECSLVALHERGLSRHVPGRSNARDLRDMREVPASALRASGSDCPERFGSERWRAFGDDVVWFTERWPDHIWHAVWADHGYHPPPAWTGIGAAVAALAPTGSPAAMWILSRLDRLLVALTLVVAVWGFGLESACLLAIAWGTGLPWRYTWLGDAFLRHLWWIAAVAGVCLLRRGRPGAAGAALGSSALLRLFPGAMGLGVLLHAGLGRWRERRPDPRVWRFVGGGAAAGVVLLVLAALSAGAGVSAHLDFASKISSFTGHGVANALGLRPLADWLLPERPLLAGALRLAVMAFFAVAFARALARVRDWEAAILGLCMIPFVTQPTNYYHSFLCLGALLALERPAVSLAALTTVLALSLNALVFYRSYTEFHVASALVVAGCLAMTFAFARPHGAGAAHAGPDPIP